VANSSPHRTQKVPAGTSFSQEGQRTLSTAGRA
jgi:hypothetical protein